MSTCNSNIGTFNKYVSSTVSGLEARNEEIDDLLTQLFAGYKIASDTKFVAYTELQETQCMQGSPLSAELLMIQALNYYKNKIIKKLGVHRKMNSVNLLQLAVLRYEMRKLMIFSRISL